ncbi:hypothetical protein [Erythrobacter sp.]|uniref:hypothetical protein n=1 Tax=Erythrobacter sp. TaxID=1042 RepID=UPI0025E1CB4B|nr:hypothetical protein [Erythrobacter sp.]
MTRAPIPLFRPAAALAALVLAVPLGAQPQSPGSYSLPEPTPTPTPAPAGPVDERAGVAIPPRAVETPRIAPVPTLTPEPSPTPRPLVVPQPTARPVTPSATPAPQAAPSPEVPPPATADPLPSEVQPGFAGLEQPANSATAPASAEAATPAPSSALGQQVFSWAWLAGAAAVLALGLAGLALWRRRKPKVLSLAAPLATHAPAPAPELPRLDLTLDITGATRSVMMFTLQYRLSLANRTDRAVNGLAVAVQLASAQKGESNAAPPAAARQLNQLERIGPHQSRSVIGEVQMPLSAIIPIMQGHTPLFIPLVHVTLEGEGQQALARSFVIGSPSGGSDGRVQPLNLHQPPGSLPGLRAKAIAAAAD